MNPLRWRKMTWVLNIWNVLFLIWVISAGGTSANCDKADPNYDACKLGETAGKGIGITLILILWFIGFVILSLIWLMTRRRNRQCPHCGHDVKKGLTACKNCGYDFTIGGKPPVETEAPAS